jgi:very-short-patch-repair endonuclease
MQNFGPNDAYRKRYNVAASRAKDQLWVVDSLDAANDLKPGDIRKRIIDYSLNPSAFENINEEIEKKSESPFEAAVARTLASRGFHLVQQWKVGGAYRLDMVAVCGKKCVAIECDGERWHSGEAKIREDMERQTILERIGWRFIRIRGSEYYRNPDATMERVILELGGYGIEPEDQYSAPDEIRTTELLQRTKARAAAILTGFGATGSNGVDFGTIAFALKTKEPEINDVPLKKQPLESENQPGLRVVNSESISTKPIKEPAKITVSEILNNHDPKGDSMLASTIQSAPVPIVNSMTGVDNTNKLEHNENKSHIVLTETSKDYEQLTIPASVNNKSASNDVIALIKDAGIEYIDKRDKGGALWIVGNRDHLAELVKKCHKFGVYFTFKAGGGRATKNRDGWWAK